MESVSQETNIKFTSRQLAPSLESEIIEFAEKLNLVGNQRSFCSFNQQGIRPMVMPSNPKHILKI